MADSVQEHVGTSNYEKVRRWLTPFFPGGKVTDAHVDGAVLTAWGNYQPGYSHVGIPPKPEWRLFEWLRKKFEEQIQVASLSQAYAHPLYMAHARHDRTIAYQSTIPFESAFEVQMPYVRVVLPQSLPPDQNELVISTVAGEVRLKGDHLAGSIDQVAEKYGDAPHLGYKPERVELITTPRYGGTRYAGAIGIYLGYRKADDTAPSFYLLEAGLATGEPQVLYFGRTMDAIITSPSCYQVTPFANKENTYRGSLTMQAENKNEPDTLTVSSFQMGQQQPYITVTSRLVRIPTLKPTPGSHFFYEAALRIVLLGNGMGVHVFGLPNLVQNAVATAGERLYSWSTCPPNIPIKK